MEKKAQVKQYTVDDCVFEVIESGEGQPVVMLQVWHPYAKYFANALPKGKNRRVITVDIPGYYTGRQARPVTDINRLVDVLDKLFDQMGLVQLDVVGQCLGGVIGTLLAAKYPRRVHKLVFATPPFVYWEPGISQLTRGVFSVLERGKRRKRWLAYVMRKSIIAKMADFFGGYHGFMGLIVQDASRSVGEFDERVFFGILGSAFRLDLWQTLARIRCPVLLVAGEHDASGRNGRLKQAQQSMQRAKITIVPRARHAMVLKNTSAFHSAVVEFLWS